MLLPLTSSKPVKAKTGVVARLQSQSKNSEIFHGQWCIQDQVFYLRGREQGHPSARQASHLLKLHNQEFKEKLPQALTAALDEE